MSVKIYKFYIFLTTSFILYIILPPFEQLGLVKLQVVMTDPHRVVIVGEDIETQIQEKLHQSPQTEQQDLQPTLSWLYHSHTHPRNPFSLNVMNCDEL
ncbi:MAG: hypothetical protein ACFFAJ_12880 [Candidatus Hodarchaeota archaeon]